MNFASDRRSFLRRTISTAGALSFPAVGLGAGLGGGRDDLFAAGSGQLWFEHDSLPGHYVAYQYECAADGKFWLEDDDGFMYGFTGRERREESEGEVRRLWLLEDDDRWRCYAYLTDEEAEQRLRDV